MQIQQEIQQQENTLRGKKRAEPVEREKGETSTEIHQENKRKKGLDTMDKVMAMEKASGVQVQWCL